MLVYRELDPPPELAGHVRSLWELRGRAPSGPARILPDGCLDLVFYVGHMGARGHAVGPLLGPLEVGLTGDVHVVGVCVRPGAGFAVLGLPADAVAGAAVPLRDLPGAGATAVEEAVAGACDGRALAELASRLTPRCRNRGPDASCLEAARRLRVSPGLAIPAVAAALGLSVRQLERRFRASVGLTPKAFARVARFDRAVRALGADPAQDLAALALDCGYADQAHFNHEFRALAGTSPRAHVANRQDAAHDST